MTFWRSMPVWVSHFGDYILFIKIAVLTALPGRAREAELGAGCALHHRGVPALEQLLDVKYNLHSWVTVPRFPCTTWPMGALVARGAGPGFAARGGCRW